MRVSNYVISSPLGDERFSILLHGLNGNLDKVSAMVGEYLLSHRSKDVTDLPWSANPSITDHLVERGYLTSTTFEEETAAFVEVAAVLHESDLQRSPPGFVFIPAYTCNLRCPYCFQPHEMHAGRGDFGTVMSPRRIDQAFQVIDRLSSPGSVHRMVNSADHSGLAMVDPTPAPPRFGLFGGEPLAGNTRKTVEGILEKVRERGSALWAITNAVELDQYQDLLGPDGLCELQITLDGLAELHDQRRIGPGFRRTFERILDHVDMALDSGVRVAMRMNIDTSNFQQLAGLSEVFNDRGWSSNSLFSASAATVTGEMGHQVLITDDDLVRATRELQNTGKSCISSYEGKARSLLRRALNNDYPFVRATTCSAETGSLMFDPFGNLYSCWEDVGMTDHKVGTYAGGKLNLDMGAMSAWLSRFPGSIDQCSQCPYGLIHTGGCGSHARIDNGTLFSAACEGFQDYFPRTLAEAWQDVESQLFDQKPTVATSSTLVRRSLPISAVAASV